MFADAHLHLLHTAPEDVQDMLTAIANTGVTDASLLAVCPMEEYGVLQNFLILWWKKHFCGMKLRAFGSLHEANDLYGSVPYEKQLKALLDFGCDGIKFIHMKPDIRKQVGKGIDDPSYDGVFAEMEARGIPVLIHSGDPESFWDPALADPRDVARGWFYGDGTYCTWKEIYGETLRRLDKNPNLKVTMAHFFFLSEHLDEAIRVMETYPNVSFDLTPGREMYVNFSANIDAWHDFFEKYSDRLLFGTDSEDMRCVLKHDFVLKALTHDRTEFYDDCFQITVKGLDLSAETVEKICYKNYINFVGEINPSPSEENLLALGRRLYEDLNTHSADVQSVQRLEEYLKIGANFL